MIERMSGTEDQRRLRRSEATSATAEISVVMPAYNARGFVDRSLPPLIAMWRRAEVKEVILVDDGSSDGTAEAAAALGAWVISTNRRLGQAAARNLGSQRASGDILWFVDADVAARDGGPGHIRHGLGSRDVTAIFGSYDDTPPAPNFLSQYKNLVHHFHHQTSLPDVSTFWSGCGAIWKEAFLAVGGFDPARSAIEDIEFGYRLKAAGGRIHVVPELQGTHLKVWKFRGLMITEIRDRAIPLARLVIRRGAGNELNIAITERIRAFIACLGTVLILTSLFGVTPWWLPVLFVLLAFAANLDLLALFERRNGWLFAIGGLLFHQFYYLYSSATYAWCWVAAAVDTPQRSQ